jgi:hypothetical protein
LTADRPCGIVPFMQHSFSTAISLPVQLSLALILLLRPRGR